MVSPIVIKTVQQHTPNRRFLDTGEGLLMQGIESGGLLQALYDM